MLRSFTSTLSITAGGLEPVLSNTIPLDTKDVFCITVWSCPSPRSTVPLSKLSVVNRVTPAGIKTTTPRWFPCDGTPTAAVLIAA